MVAGPLRADARRNRARILAAAGELFASQGSGVGMDEIASAAGVGVGSLYRHFPNKDALLTAIIRERFAAVADFARTAEQNPDAREAFRSVLTVYLEAADGDAAFQLAVLGSPGVQWSGLDDQKADLAEVVGRIIRRAATEGRIRSDLTWDDFPMIVCGIMSTMYFKPGGADWRRHLDLVLEGISRG